MAKTVHARLDDQSEAALRRLRRDTGLGDSELLRRGLRALAAVSGSSGARKIIGLGAFASGQPDLGSNKKHLSGFGKSYSPSSFVAVGILATRRLGPNFNQ
jgi:hypothetical protein